MDAKTFNDKEVAAGRLTPVHLNTLALFSPTGDREAKVAVWQKAHRLTPVDSMAGSATQASLSASSAHVRAASTLVNRKPRST